MNLWIRWALIIAAAILLWILVVNFARDVSEQSGSLTSPAHSFALRPEGKPGGGHLPG
jgi:hypothetical protein